MIDLALTCLAVMLWYARPELGPWPLLLVAAGRAWRELATRDGRWTRQRRLARTPFDLPLLLFLASAALAAWISFDRAAGSAKFWQIVGAVALFDSLAFAPERAGVPGLRFSPVRWFLLFLPALIAAYALLTTDWTLVLGKVPPLDPAIRWFASWQPALATHAVHPNVAGGLIAALIPLQVVAAATARAPSPGRAAAWLLVALSFAGLVMTASRGAWLGLAAVGAACLLWAVTRRRSAGGLGWSRRTWGVLGGIALAGMAGMAALAWVWGPVLAPGGRIDLLRNSIDLALDTPFTGIGLGKGVFMMAYSTYVLVLHVGQTIHSHVLPLNIWLEQGLLGLAAFAWLLVAAVRARYVSPAWRAAGLASLGVILLHGLVDDSLYGSRGVVLLFVPLAILAREDLRFALEYGSLPRAVRGPAAALGRGAAPTRAGAFSRVAAVGLALVVTLLLIAALLPPVRAAFQADLGALAQTRAELSVYRWPDWPVQDALRRSPQVDLAPAIARYRAALALDPANVTANRRLGQIEMSRGDYAAALAHLQRAYAAAPDQRATRQLLGEAYAVTGDTARAAELWATVDLSAGQLPGRAWWYDHVGEKAIAGRIQEAGG